MTRKSLTLVRNDQLCHDTMATAPRKVTNHKNVGLISWNSQATALASVLNQIEMVQCRLLHKDVTNSSKDPA